VVTVERDVVQLEDARIAAAVAAVVRTGALGRDGSRVVFWRQHGIDGAAARRERL
jgi:hypothetical protein